MKIKFFAILLLSCFALSAQEFKFKTETINYGTITKSSEGKRVFEFENIGNAPLTIDRISSSCGCTIPKKPEKPIMPGEAGKIEVSYDTKRIGRFSKNITIFSNAKTPTKIIRIKGIITEQVIPLKKKSILSN